MMTTGRGTRRSSGQIVWKPQDASAMPNAEKEPPAVLPLEAGEATFRRRPNDWRGIAKPHGFLKGSPSMSSLLACLFSAVAVMLGCTSGEKQVPKVTRMSHLKQLVDESTKEKSASQSSLLSTDPLGDRGLPEALAYINKHPDYTSYLVLLAVRKYYSASYKGLPDEVKSAILCSALKNSIFLNDWGALAPDESFDDESAKALLETGKVALKCLGPILDDDQEAPLWGSKDSTISHAYRYRRKDFAYRYASLILSKSPVFRANPKERDKDIERLKAELKKHPT
jgi:hypothetical protein